MARRLEPRSNAKLMYVTGTQRPRRSTLLVEFLIKVLSSIAHSPHKGRPSALYQGGRMLLLEVGILERRGGWLKERKPVKISV
jgi:hypothetical protein